MRGARSCFQIMFVATTILLKASEGVGAHVTPVRIGLPQCRVRPTRRREGFRLTSLKSEIAQEAPFSSTEEEAILNVMRTSDCLEHAFQQRTRGFGLTPTQYNVLRILRGAQPCGLPCAAIGERMIAAEPDITRLLGRLKRLKLIRQHRDRHDRRVVLTQISDTGLELLRTMDPLIQRITVELLGGLSGAELAEMIRLLERARESCAEANIRAA
jgi:DNA-binding MarR family transcriptional regulator